jgi:hypothetical protein
MPRRTTPNASNREAGTQMIQDIATQITRRSTTGVRLLSLYGGYGAVTGPEAMDALEALRAADAEADEIVWELLGAAVLAGASIEEMSERTGIPQRTLTRRLPAWVAELSGQRLVRDRKTERGWRVDER